jgi:hypothetical protein
MMMVMELGVRRVVKRTELEDVCEGWEEEEKQLQKQLLCRSDTKQDRKHEHQFHLDQLYHHH